MIHADSPAINLIALWPALFVVIWAIWNVMRDSRQEKAALRSTNWPEVPGKVKTSKAVWGHYEVTYEYVVEGRFYSGTYEINLSPVAPDRFARGATQLLAEIKGDLAEFPPGLDVTIKYNPQEPAQSMLLCRSKSIRATSRQTDPPNFLTLS